MKKITNEYIHIILYAYKAINVFWIKPQIKLVMVKNVKLLVISLSLFQYIKNNSHMLLQMVPSQFSVPTPTLPITSFKIGNLKKRLLIDENRLLLLF